MTDDLRTTVRKRYAQVPGAIRADSPASCCERTQGAATDQAGDSALSVKLTGNGYARVAAELPEAALKASLGCGNPVDVADLAPGEVVLDLGSGGGIDVLLSARRVGPEGKVYGIDMTEEMLELARQNQAESGVENAEFLNGEIEDIPLPDHHVDVILSNCVINLSTDKDQAFREAFRVLKPGGRWAVYDMVLLQDRNELNEEFVRQAELWAGCVAGALTEKEYRGKLEAAGFTDVEIIVNQAYSGRNLPGADDYPETDLLPDTEFIASAFVRARKLQGE